MTTVGGKSHAERAMPAILNRSPDSEAANVRSDEGSGRVGHPTADGSDIAVRFVATSGLSGHRCRAAAAGGTVTWFEWNLSIWEDCVAR
jgi:hypothetical protein